MWKICKKRLVAISTALLMVFGTVFSAVWPSLNIKASDNGESEAAEDGTNPNLIYLDATFYDYYSDSQVDGAYTDSTGKVVPGEISDAVPAGVVVKKETLQSDPVYGDTYYKEYASVEEAEADCTEAELATLRYGTFESWNNAMLEEDYADSVYDSERWDSKTIEYLYYYPWSSAVGKNESWFRETMANILEQGYYYHYNNGNKLTTTIAWDDYTNGSELKELTINALQSSNTFEYTVPDNSENTVYPLYMGDWGSDFNPNPLWQERYYFMPLVNHVIISSGNENYVTQGLVDSTLSDGTVTQTKNNIDGTKGTAYKLPYFDEEFINSTYDNGLTHGAVYEDLTFPVRTYPSAAGVITYEYDSSLDSSYINVDDDGTASMEYTGYGDVNTQVLDRYKNKPSFLPFNTPEESSSNSLNYGFGAKIEFEYNIKNAGDSTQAGTVKNGQVYGTDGNLEDLYFGFSGDDDVWVFVDGKLVLDMGGIHEKSTGSIDFANYTSTVKGIKSLYSIRNNSKNIMGYESLEDYDNTNKKYVDFFELIKTKLSDSSVSDVWNGWNGSYEYNSYNTTESISLSDLGLDVLGEGEHTLTIFYMERGKVESNFSMKTNLPITQSSNRVVVDENVDVEGVNSEFLDIVESEIENTVFEVQVNKESYAKLSSSDQGKIFLKLTDDLAAKCVDGVPWVWLGVKNNYTYWALKMEPVAGEEDLYVLDLEEYIDNQEYRYQYFGAAEDGYDIVQIQFYDGTSNWKYWQTNNINLIKFGYLYELGTITQNSQINDTIINSTSIESLTSTDGTVNNGILTIDPNDTIFIKSEYFKNNGYANSMLNLQISGVKEIEDGEYYIGNNKVTIDGNEYYYFYSPGLAENLQNSISPSINFIRRYYGGTIQYFSLSDSAAGKIYDYNSTNGVTEISGVTIEPFTVDLTEDTFVFVFPENNEQWPTDKGVYMHAWNISNGNGINIYSSYAWPGFNITNNVITTADGKKYYYFHYDGLSAMVEYSINNGSNPGIIFSSSDGWEQTLYAQTSNIEGDNLQSDLVYELKVDYKNWYNTSLKPYLLTTEYVPNELAATGGLLSLKAKGYTTADTDIYEKEMIDQFTSTLGAQAVQTADDRFITTYKITDMTGTDGNYVDNNVIKSSTTGLAAGDGRTTQSDAFQVYNSVETVRADSSAMINVHVSFLNTVKTNSLSITKKLVKDGKETTKSDEEFKFILKFSNVFNSGSTETLYNGVYTINGQKYTAKDGVIIIKAGQTAVISGIPYDTKYTLSEITDGLEEKGYSFVKAEASNVDALVANNTIAERLIETDAEITYTNEDLRVDISEEGTDIPVGDANPFVPLCVMSALSGAVLVVKATYLKRKRVF